jgi:hypothetical protein
MPTTLTDLLNAIPVAEDDHVISAHHHNSIRETLLRLATDVGSAPGSQIETITHVPQFLQNGDGPNWKVMNGLATRDANGPTGDGYFAIQLPHGALIKTLTVTGRKTGGVLSFGVKLMRVDAISGNNDELIRIDLQNASDPFKETQGIRRHRPEEFGRVDAKAFTYLFIAQAARVSDFVQINSLAISYVRP